MHIYDTENIKFQINFKVDVWDKPVNLKIFINEYFLGEYFLFDSQSIQFKHELAFNQDHTLIIHRSGKTSNCTDSLRHLDQFASIESIFIDDINVNDIVVSNCEYYPEYPELWASEQQALGIDLEYPVKQELYFGHNGIWKYNFRSPFYRYLLHQVTGI
jgi:hypothetical protein